VSGADDDLRDSRPFGPNARGDLRRYTRQYSEAILDEANEQAIADASPLLHPRHISAARLAVHRSLAWAIMPSRAERA
jgi:hypothetical protein